MCFKILNLPQVSDTSSFFRNSTQVDSVLEDSIVNQVNNDSVAVILDTSFAAEAGNESSSTAAPTEEGTTMVSPLTNAAEEKTIEISFAPLPEKESEITYSPFQKGDLQTLTQVKPEGMVAQEKQESSAWWFLAPLFLILVLLASISVFTNKKVRQYFNATVSNRFIDQLMREEDAALTPLNLSLLLIYLLSFSVLIFNGIYFFSPALFGSVDLLLFAYVILALGGYFVLKMMLISLSKALFGVTQAIDAFQFNLLLFTKVLGLLLVLPAIFSCFGYTAVREGAFWMGLGIYALMIMIRLTKSFIGGLGFENTSLYYIILYICSLEILPLVIVVKTMVS